MTSISPDIFQTQSTVGIIRSSLRWWGRLDVHSILDGVHSACIGRSRLQTRMRTMAMISIVLALPLPDGDRPRFNSPVAGTGDQSCSAGEEARAFDGALLAGAHRPMQAQWRALCHWDASCGTVPPCTFVPSAATCYVKVDVTRSGRCCSASLHSSPSFFPSLQ